MCSAGQLNVQTDARKGSGPDDSRQPAVTGVDCGAGDIMCVGVILGFPPDIARELQEWRASFGDPMAEVVPAHITLITTTPTQDWEATREHVRGVAKTQQPFNITISGTGSFRPVSPVVFVNVEEGFEECVQLHQKLQSGPLERMLPFPYHPHVTVAHDVAQKNLDEAETVLRDYRATFPVVSMGLYEHDTNGIWQLREELDFGGNTYQDQQEDSSRGGGHSSASH